MESIEVQVESMESTWNPHIPHGLQVESMFPCEIYGFHMDFQVESIFHVEYVESSPESMGEGKVHIFEALTHAVYQNKLLNGKGNSLRVIPVKTSWAEKVAGNRVMEPTIRLHIARDGRL